MTARKVQVNGCRLQIGMAEHHLNAAEIGTGFQQVGCETVPESVRSDSLLNSRAFRRFANGLPDDLL